MAIHVDWFGNTEKIICWKFDKAWNWEEFSSAVRQSDEMSKDCNYPVDLILDLTNSAYRFTLNPSRIHHGMSVATAQNGIVVIVSDKRAVQTLVTIFARVYPTLGKYMYIVETPSDAVETIQNYRTNNS